ncbi:MAG: AbrB/MazE/SpoVT family DNA-binding domain-containing protein [Candidatus Sumerlaeaceae bacterium]|nr:AbrB/MazE/SpoVT family DNA-binding domain-containing protein [Candidatus Sumerlaeaceae bacterium]
MPSATLTVKGQLVIPKEIRDRLGLKPGDKLDFLPQESGDILMRPLVQDVSKLRGLLRRPGAKPVSLEEMDTAVRKRFGQR